MISPRKALDFRLFRLLLPIGRLAGASAVYEYSVSLTAQRFVELRVGRRGRTASVFR